MLLVLVLVLVLICTAFTHLRMISAGTEAIIWWNPFRVIIYNAENTEVIQSQFGSSRVDSCYTSCFPCTSRQDTMGCRRTSKIITHIAFYLYERLVHRDVQIIDYYEINLCLCWYSWLLCLLECFPAGPVHLPLIIFFFFVWWLYE